MDEEFMPQFHDTPRIASDFTGWHYKNMRELVPFCQDNDPDPPDFVEMCYQERKIKDRFELSMETLEEREIKIVEARTQKYYEETWSQVIMKILRYKNPLIANAHMIT